MDDLAIAFAMRCDQQDLTYEAGLRAAQDLSEELTTAAEDRLGIARYESREGNNLTEEG